MQSETDYSETKRNSKDSTLLSSQKNKSDNVLDSSTKILAWILLFIGILCIISPIIYITIWLDGDDSPVDEDTKKDFKIGNKLDKITELSKYAMEPFGKLSDSFGIRPPTRQGCYELSCRIECFNSTNFYLDTAYLMSNSSCVVISSLAISNSHEAYIEDRWIAMSNTVKKIVLYNNQIMKIRSGAFNSPMFAKVVHMTWIDMKVDELSRGALLGLYSLRKLEVEIKVPRIEITFLQPVQVTLTHLRLNCGISFKSNANIFENISLDKLKHLDLSHNTFMGALSKRLFSGTPNVAYLYLKYCMIRSIDDNAFEDIANKLILVDLKHNFLTQINADLLGMGGSLLLVDVEPNNWICNCQLRSLIKFYKEHKNLFISAPYCRMPLSLFGKQFDELQDLEMSCEPSIDDITVTTDGTGKEEVPTQGDTLYNDDDDVEPTNKTIVGPIIQFSCTQAIDIEKTVDERDKRDLETTTTNTIRNSFVFEPPPYDLNLSLLQNYSVKAFIDGFILTDKLNIIWFTEDIDNYPVGSYPKDYNCMQYENPYIIIDSVKENQTYTFCMMYLDEFDISPLFCQPFHIPISHYDAEADDIWIDESEKQFTIGMLCLIFFISTVFGAIFAYLGLKSFPNLLEGSKNVLVIKESEKTCHVSTIADPSSVNKGFMPDSSFKIRNHKLSEVSTGLSGIQVASPLSYASSSTYFEESFSHIDMQSIEYEMPMQFNKERSKLSECQDRPNSPPPLPKRNSTLSLRKDQQMETYETPNK